MNGFSSYILYISSVNQAPRATAGVYQRPPGFPHLLFPGGFSFIMIKKHPGVLNTGIQLLFEVKFLEVFLS
jgi:hypothetical protein